MNKQSALCRAFVLTVMILAGIEAQAFANAGLRDQISEKKTTTKQVRSYVCPMHPDVKSTKRGKCPKCKMDLRLERVADNAVAAAMRANVTDTANTESNESGSARKMVIPDVEVLDQNGNALHFYSDLIKGKTVAINFIFTNHVSWLEDLVYQIDITSGNAGRQCDNTSAR